MATAYIRFRFNWGGLDITAAEQETPSYSSTQIASAGESALVGEGVGVRRATLVLDRTAARAGADSATMHLDFLNTTGGTADDTWTTGDFTTLEALIETFWTAAGNYASNKWKLTEIDWHRVGSGISKPNPAERQLLLTSALPGGASFGQHGQTACSITFRTGVRASWGRTYVPYGGGADSTGAVDNTHVDTIATAAHTLVQAAAAADFHLVVVSKHLHSALVVEKVECDNTLDIIRRRRWKQSTYRKILP